MIMKGRMSRAVSAAVLIAAVIFAAGCGRSDDMAGSNANSGGAEYQIAKIEEAGSVRDIDWESIETVPIDQVMWTPDAGIRAEGQLCHDDENIYVHLKAKEKDIRAENTEPLSPVYEDSCLEFFFMLEGDDQYFNFEANPNGVLNIQYGLTKTDRMNLVRPDAEEYFDIKTGRTDDGWEIFYRIPMAFIHECCPDLSFSSAIRANLFKCGNKTVHRHYISWKRVNTAQPNFHVTEAFGTMSFEQ